MQARLLIGDTIQGKQQLQDEEINFALTRYATIYGACAEMCRDLSMRYATQVDLVQGELKTNYSQISKVYAARATDFEQRGLRGVVPYAGGISNADKANVMQDTDRVPPDFQRTQFDDLLPVGPAGQQSASPSLPDTDQVP